MAVENRVLKSFRICGNCNAVCCICLGDPLFTCLRCGKQKREDVGEHITNELFTLRRRLDVLTESVAENSTKQLELNNQHLKANEALSTRLAKVESVLNKITLDKLTDECVRAFCGISAESSFGVGAEKHPPGTCKKCNTFGNLELHFCPKPKPEDEKVDKWQWAVVWEDGSVGVTNRHYHDRADYIVQNGEEKTYLRHVIPETIRRMKRSEH